MLRRRHVFVLVTALFTLSGVALFGPHDRVEADKAGLKLAIDIGAGEDRRVDRRRQDIHHDGKREEPSGEPAARMVTVKRF